MLRRARASTIRTKIGAEQAWSGSVQSTTDYGNAEEFNASIQTRFADYVRYHEARMNIYIYPVIGKTACPADKVTGTPPNTSCTVPEGPLTVQFSGPDQAFHAERRRHVARVVPAALAAREYPLLPREPGPVAGAPTRPGQVFPGRHLSHGRACGHGKHHMEWSVWYEHHHEHLLELLLRCLRFIHGSGRHRWVLREGESHR